jgi:putative membrane protein
MKRLSIIGLLIGVGILTLLVIREGLGLVEQILTDVGGQVFWLPVFYLVPIGCALLSWLYLFRRGERPTLTFSLYAVWISFAINWLLPVGQVGGEIARIRMMLKRQFVARVAIATVIGDQTLQVVTQAVYCLLGFVLFIYVELGQTQLSGQIVWSVLGGVVLFGIASVILYWLQQAGLAQLLARIARKFAVVQAGESIAAQAAQVDEALKAMYQRRDRLLIAALWRFAFRITAAGETWLAFRFLGHPVTVVDALILESIGQAVRSAAFFIPGGLGAQEGAIVLVGAALGIPTEIALAASLCKRVRELGLGVPGLLAWQVEEGRRVFRQ